MRVLCTTQPAHGHFRPLLPVARALEDRGHEVRVGTSARFAPVVEAEGFAAIAAGLDWLEADKSTIPDDRRPGPSVASLATFFAHQFIRMTAADLAADVIASVDAWRPDIIVRETTEFGGLLAGDALTIPVAAVQVGSPSLIDDDVRRETAAALDEARDRLGIPPDPTGARHEADPLICFAPEALHDPAVALPAGLRTFRPAPFAPTAIDSILDGLGLDRPLVYGTLGTVFHTAHYDLPFFPAVLEAARDLPVDLVLAIGPGADPASLGAVPRNVRVATFVPQRAVLDRCVAAICHGGYGTVLDAIDAAVPMVVVPFGADQYVNADSVVRLGIGSSVDEDALDASTIRQAIIDLLADHGTRDRIRVIRDAWHAAPGPAAAAIVLERLAEHGRATSP